ncbi:MAG TPA: class I SAM-dependent methyltransferase [Anaerolineales bacterium]|nr:class I SAM-dependent methyltransferase [Anaerolineales bacterium]
MVARDFHKRSEAAMLKHLHGTPPNPQAPGSMQGWGKIYDGIVSLLFSGQEKKIRQNVLDLAEIRPGESILEVGCGTGTITLGAKARAGTNSQVVGIDVAPDMLVTARQKAEKAGLDVAFQPGRIEEIPFPDAQFDLVLGSLMLHHIHGDIAKQQGMKEIYRVLKPGGRLFMVDATRPENPHLRGLTSLILGPEMLAHEVKEFIPLLERAGFASIETGPTKYSLFGYLRGSRPI